MNLRCIRLLYAIAALYDAALGLLFLFIPSYPFATFDVTPPNHMGYVQFPAALLLIFGFMFAMIAKAPRENRQLIIYGVLLKLSYSGLTFWYWLTTDVPSFWKPFAVIDFMMLVLFVWTYAALAPKSAEH